MKKTILLVLLVIMVSVALVAAAPGFEKLARLTIWNRTGSTIYIKLTTPKENGNLHYYLTIKTGLHVYTVQRELYDITFWSCGNTTTGVVDIFTQLSLTFTNCAYIHDTGIVNHWRYQNALVSNANVGWQEHNMGEPSMEKVHNTVKVWGWSNEKTTGCVAAYPAAAKHVYTSADILDTCPTSVTLTDAAGVATTYAVIWKNNIKTIAYKTDVYGNTVLDANKLPVPQLDANGNYIYNVYWKHASYNAPTDTGGYWFPFRLSYSKNDANHWITARQIHWFVRDSKSYQSGW
jgi:hypothetical protein